VSSYLVLARKYRPKQFSDIVGQQSVVRTLVNAIKLKRTHQAYVFSGSRGIGKTSIARIFSKALRCPNVVERDGLLYSCDQCSDCHEIAAGTSVNVLEIDGASNNGVENVREIRESAKFLPSSGQYKIYIIDEVHMLSNQAFNALLKTLEEPPEHIVFIFATTESHKIPETILGRCQRFDFKRVTVAQIMDRIKDVLAAEKIESESAALNLISRAAEGSMRDALSILDQVISFSGMKVTASAVRESIGLIGTELVFALLKNVLERNAKGALEIVQNAFNQGVDLKVLLKSLIEMIHALLLMKAGVEKPETNFNDDELTQLKTQINAREIEEIELIFQVYHHGLDLLSRAAQPKLIFDLLVIKTALADALVKVGAQNLSEAAATPRRAARPEVSVEAPAPVKTPELVEPASGLGFSFHGDLKPKTESKPEVQRVSVTSGPKTWEKLIELSTQTRPVLGILLESVVEWSIPQHSDEKFKLGFREKDRIKADQLQQKAMKDQFLLLTEAFLGFKAQPEVFFSELQGESLAEKSEREAKESHENKMKMIMSNEVVQEARSLFGVELTQIEMIKRDS
jgi:DNA polymerase-3 subunit gamma/tau